MIRSEAQLVEPIELAPMRDQVLTWTGVNSGTANLAGLDIMAGHLADAFAALPGSLMLEAPAPIETVTADGNLAPVAHGRHLVVRVRPEAKRRVLLTGHMDTVYAADHPFQASEWLNEDRLRGPGAADMKGGIALMLAGLKAFEASLPALGYDVLINSDEETGSASSAALIRELAQGKVAALTYEPALPGGMMARARPGSGNFAAVVTGRAAHAGRNPEDGRNAIVAAADLALRLSQAHHPALSINPAKIDGGGPNNIVPANAVLRFNLRPREPEQAAEAQTLIDRLVAEIIAEHEVAIDIHGGFGRPPKPITPDAERLFALVADAAADLGKGLRWQDTGGVCDGNNIAACGIPVIDTMGARGDFIHSPQEYLEVDSLVPRAKLTALVLHRIEKGGGISMTFVLRAALAGDLAALYQMAKSTGGGFTNLPPDRPTLKAKLARAEISFGRTGPEPGDDLFLFVLEDIATGKVRGTCQIFSRIGSTWPFYSYRITGFTQYSKELDRTIRAEMLVLSTDLDGASEVGGLFLMPGDRSAGAGALLARSRYLFVKMHRSRFAARTIAELRGAHDETGGSPFWDGVAGRFFGMSFREADEFNATRGNQFIADLMPKHPIYTALLPESALAVIGAPHQSGRAAQRMLEHEGFAYENYIDIFDGGPTMTAPTDEIATIRGARDDIVRAIADKGTDSLVAHGTLATFRACCGQVAQVEGGISLDADASAALGITVGDTITHVPR